MVENEFSKVKVNNEIDYCSVTDTDLKVTLEKAFMKARVSYFLRWDKPGVFARIFTRAKTSVVFCINQAQLETALSVIESLGEDKDKVKIINEKSNNKTAF